MRDEPRAAQIVIAISQSQIFVVNLGVDWKRQFVGSIENLQTTRNNLDVAGRELRILRSGHTRGDSAGNLNHVFAAQTVRLFRDLCILFRAKNDLGQSFAIAQIDENDAAVIA